MTPNALIALAKASASEFRAVVAGDDVRFDPELAEPHMRWRPGVALDWLDDRGFVIRRMLVGGFPILLLAPRDPSIELVVPDGEPRWMAHALAEAERTQANGKVFFGPLWPEVERWLKA